MIYTIQVNGILAFKTDSMKEEIDSPWYTREIQRIIIECARSSTKYA